jgi:ABC-type lipoprotein export system ATPase subunit
MIEVKNLSYSYSGNSEIKYPDISLRRGEHCLLIGESGSGKTTLLHLLGGLLRCQKGTITIDNQNICSMSESELDKFRGEKLGFIFQRNHLINALTVDDNLVVANYLAGRKSDRGKSAQLLSSLGLDTKQNSSVAELSQGQAQRVAIARAVMNNPSVILADEPTSALDDKNCSRVASLLIESASSANATLVIATHDHRLKSWIKNHIALMSLS